MKNYIKASLLFIVLLPITAFSQGQSDCNARSAASIFASTNPATTVSYSTVVSKKIDPSKKSSGAVRKGVR